VPSAPCLHLKAKSNGKKKKKKKKKKTTGKGEREIHVVRFSSADRKRKGKKHVFGTPFRNGKSVGKKQNKWGCKKKNHNCRVAVEPNTRPVAKKQSAPDVPRHTQLRKKKKRGGDWFKKRLPNRGKKDRLNSRSSFYNTNNPVMGRGGKKKKKVQFTAPGVWEFRRGAKRKQGCLEHPWERTKT